MHAEGLWLVLESLRSSLLNQYSLLANQLGRPSTSLTFKTYLRSAHRRDGGNGMVGDERARNGLSEPAYQRDGVFSQHLAFIYAYMWNLRCTIMLRRCGTRV